MEEWIKLMKVKMNRIYIYIWEMIKILTEDYCIINPKIYLKRTTNRNDRNMIHADNRITKTDTSCYEKGKEGELGGKRRSFTIGSTLTNPELWNQSDFNNISASLCLFNPLDCVFICIISEMILLYHAASLSRMRTLFQSNSWLCNRCVEITEGMPLLLLMSFLCSLILVISRLFVWPT